MLNKSLLILVTIFLFGCNESSNDDTYHSASNNTVNQEDCENKGCSIDTILIVNENGLNISQNSIILEKMEL